MNKIVRNSGRKIVSNHVCSFKIYSSGTLSYSVDWDAELSILRCTVGHKSHDPCFHKKYMVAGVMTFVAHCTVQCRSWPTWNILGIIGTVGFRGEQIRALRPTAVFMRPEWMYSSYVEMWWRKGKKTDNFLAKVWLFKCNYYYEMHFTGLL